MGALGSHRSDIEGLRAIAVAFVLLYHGRVPGFGGGFLGVDVFFVVSGFLITHSLAQELAERGTIDLAAFYARRVRRLLPAAATMLAVTAVAVRALLPPTSWRDFGGDIAAAAGYALNWRLALRSVDYLSEDVAASPVQHCWSLAIEEQFYLAWPLVLLLVGALARRRRVPLHRLLPAGLSALVLAPSLVWSAFLTATPPGGAFFDTGARMWELAAGGLVALAAPPRIEGPWRVALKAAALAALAGLAVGIDASAPWPGVRLALAAVIPAAMLLWLGGRGDDAVERALSLAPLQRIGAWSYSLYLWHWPPLALYAARWGAPSTARALGLVALSFVPAVLSYHCVENPLRFGRLRRSTPLSLSVGANLSLVGLAFGLLLAFPDPGEGVLVRGPRSAGGGGRPAGAVGAAVLAPDPSDEQMLASLATVAFIYPAPTAAAHDLPRIYREGCDVGLDVAEPKVCHYGDPAGTVHVALVGDSKAGQWGDALDEIGRRRGWRLTYLLKSGCELSTVTPQRGEPEPACRAWAAEVLERLVSDPPDVVLTSQVASAAWSDGGAPSRERLVEGMLEAYRRLREAGSEVVLLLDNYPPDKNVYECVSEHRDDLAACTFLRRPDHGGRAAQLAAAEAGGLAVLDLGDRICPTRTCLPVIGNVLVYRQGSHLTQSYVSTLVGALEERLAPLVESRGSQLVRRALPAPRVSLDSARPVRAKRAAAPRPG